MVTTREQNKTCRPKSWFRENIIALLLLSISFAIITSYFHHYTYVSNPNSVLVSINHLEVVSFRAEAPLQYRLGSYLVAQIFLDIAVMSGASNDTNTLLIVYFCIRMVLTTLAFLALLSFLGIWFDMKRSILGLLFFIAVNPLAEYYYFHQPGDPWILLFFILGYMAIATNRDMLLVPIILIAVPFHESIAFLVPAYLFSRLGRLPIMKVLLWTVVLCAAWLIPYAGLRYIFGILPEIMDSKLAESPYTSVLDQNFKTPRGWLVLFLCFNVLWLAIPAAWSRIPLVVRRMLFMVPLYIIVYLFQGHLIEGRHFMPLVPLFLVPGLAWLDKGNKVQGQDTAVTKQ